MRSPPSGGPQHRPLVGAGHRCSGKGASTRDPPARGWGGESPELQRWACIHAGCQTWSSAVLLLLGSCVPLPR